MQNPTTHAPKASLKLVPAITLPADLKEQIAYYAAQLLAPQVAEYEEEPEMLWTDWAGGAY